MKFARLLASSCAFALVACAATPAFADDGSSKDSNNGNADAAAQADGGDIVVTGTRAALRAAVAEKKEADNFVETLQANDVGKLPDQNVAEAVKRLPGLSVANDQGEGRYVVIRGIDPSLVNVSLNGQTLPAPEPDGRVVKLDDLPSAMIQSIVVTKSLLPDQDANAIGGDVNVKTKTAFDSRDPFFFDARGAVGRYDINHKTPWEADGTLGGRFGPDEQFGAVVSVNYSRRPIESENFQGTEDWAGGIPAGGGLRDYNLTRTRLGVVGNFDWHPSDSAKIYIRSSYSKYQDHETRDQNLLSGFSGSDEDNPSTTGSAATTILVRHREENDNTKSLTLGGDFDVGGGKLSLSGGWTKAVKIDPIRSEFTFAGPTVDATYDSSTYPYSLLPSGANADVFDDPSQFKFSKLKAETRSTYERIWQGRIDYSHPIGIGDDSEIKVGFKYLDRHKDDNHDLISYKKGTAWTLDTVGYTGNTDFYEGLFDFGERIDWYKAEDYLAANPSVGKFDYAGNLEGSLSSDYDAREEILAGYAMATLRFGNLTIIPGVRVEHTRDRTAAKLVDPTTADLVAGVTSIADYEAVLAANNDFNVFGNNSYTDVFPGLNAKLEIRPDLLLRAGVTTSIGRPNYSTLAPFTMVEDGTPATVTMGNPNLKPYKALNFDAAVEYYPTPDSLFSAGLFYKKIDNPIYQVPEYGIANPGGIAGASVEDYPTIDLLTYVNMDSENIGGIEINVQTQFTALPGVLSGFGISANYTHTWGHATGAAFRAGDIPLAYQSRDLGNVSLFYEKYGFAARLAFNYRSAFIDVVAQTADQDSYWDAQGQLDLHVSYQVAPQFTVFADGTNLTDSPWHHYLGQPANLVERERYGAQFRVGAQVHF
ncbi:MAG: TonB-dependent receptor [Novosphingobium sp.]|nr:TonB-dependent receptor [Novosphingobium sp.]